MSVGDRDVNSGLFRARRENSTCLCVSVTQVPPVFLPLVCPSQPALLSIPQANTDVLNHSTPLLSRAHIRSRVPPADSLNRIPPRHTFQNIPAKTLCFHLNGICAEWLPTWLPTGENVYPCVCLCVCESALAGRGPGSLYKFHVSRL